MTLAVSPGSGPGFSPMVIELSESGAAWSAYLTGIPAGPGRQFDVVALDANGQTLYSGSGKTDIAAGASAFVSIELSAPPPPPLQNAVPVIDFLAVSATNVLAGSKVSVTATAHDPDPGGTVAYLWTSTCGAFDAPSAPAAVWTAPANGQSSCALTVTIADGRGASVSASVTVAVQ